MRQRIADRSHDAWAPIALFLFNRPDHTRQTITGLQACHGFAKSPIYVYADGPRHERDLAAVHATRAVARELLGKRAVFVEREANFGLTASIISGVTELCDRYGTVIVVEDDLALAPYFLQFLNEGLRRYADEPRVMQVSAHTYDVPALRQHREALFLPVTDSWGWGTWKRAWDLFDRDAHGWQDLLRDRRERKQFDLNGRTPKSEMLALQMRSDIGGWDVAWYYTVYKAGGLVLFPPRTLVYNLGLDGSGVHGRLALPARQAPLALNETFDFPSQVVESPAQEHMFKAIGAFQPRGKVRQALALVQRLPRRWGFTFRRAESGVPPAPVGTSVVGQQAPAPVAVATRLDEGE